MSYVSLLDGSPIEEDTVGGKAASLGRLCALGAPVPPAVALTTEAYRSHVRLLDVPARASDVADGDLPEVRRIIVEADLPHVVSQAIASGMAAIDPDPDSDARLAVRSSATAEDSRDFSFAGLHDTVLGVGPDLPSVERAVKQCWASLWSERGVQYRRRGDETLDSAAMGVVIQRQVACDVSFVAFSADPIDLCADFVIISATYGLGEAVVSGLVTPDHIVVAPDGSLARYDIGAKEVMIIPAGRNGGVRQAAVPRMLASQPVMSHDRACEIARLARRLESAYGLPLDIEGGLVDGQTFVFQARPITTCSREL
jgi:rifampicin phosphotransferase